MFLTWMATARSLASYELIKHQHWKVISKTRMTCVAHQSMVCSIKSLDCSLESEWWMAWEVSRAEVRWGGKMWCYFPGQIEEVSSLARKSGLLCSDTTDKWEAYHHAGLSYISSWCHSSGCNKISRHRRKKCTACMLMYRVCLCEFTACSQDSFTFQHW